MKFRFYPILSILIVASLALAACSSLPGAPGAGGTPTPLPTVIADTNVVAEGKIVPKETAQLAFYASGQVDEVLVEEGDVIKKGDVVARLGNREQLEAAIAGADAELVAAKQALKALDDNLSLGQADASNKVSTTQKALKDAQYALDNFTVPSNMKGMTPKEAIAAMKVILDQQRERFEPYRYYPEDDRTRKDRKEDLDSAQSDYNTAIRWLQLETNVETAQTQLDEAIKDFDKLSKGPDPDKVEAAQARIKAAEASLASAHANLDNLELTSTIDGTVVKLDLKVGQNVSPGAPVMTIADFSEMYAETDDLTEIEVVEISLEQQATVVPDALPELELAGTVDKIDDISEEKRGDVTYTVRVKLNESDPRLRWGMTVVITFAKP